MSAKPGTEVDALDLAIAARRGELGPREQQALEQALEASAALRTAYELGCDFDLASRIRPGDEALVARAAERGLTRGAGRRSRRLGLLGSLLAATLVIASAAAATRAVFVRHGTAQALLRPAPAPATAAKATVPVAHPGVAHSATASPAPPGEELEPPEVVPPAPPRATARAAREVSPAAAASSTPALADTPESLFERAGAARRAGALGTARALYLELQARFPGSSAARVSYVSLGKLLLAAGRAREADAAFTSYLGGGAGELREEALVGRADALFALGRTQEERSLRQELIRLHPTSVYASRARERVAEIDRAQAPNAP